MCRAVKALAKGAGKPTWNSFVRRRARRSISNSFYCKETQNTREPKNRKCRLKHHHNLPAKLIHYGTSERDQTNKISTGPHLFSSIRARAAGDISVAPPRPPAPPLPEEAVVPLPPPPPVPHAPPEEEEEEEEVEVDAYGGRDDREDGLERDIHPPGCGGACGPVVRDEKGNEVEFNLESSTVHRMAWPASFVATV